MLHDRVGILNFESRCLNYELLNTEVFVDPRQFVSANSTDFYLIVVKSKHRSPLKR